MRSFVVFSSSLMVSALALLGCDYEPRQLECDQTYIRYSCHSSYYGYYGTYRSCRAYRYFYACEGDAGSSDAGSETEGELACSENRDCERGESCDDGVCSSDSRESRRNSRRGRDGESDAGSPASENSSSAGAEDSGADAPSGGISSSDNSSSVETGGDGDEAQSSADRRRRFGFPCARDAQCGEGQCVEGECFEACVSDEQCGTGDRCAVESGRRICEPDVTPALSCADSSDCDSGATCVNGTCHPGCDFDTECSNGADRCLFNLCTADRRPIAECAVNAECSTGEVCSDGRCVNLATVR